MEIAIIGAGPAGLVSLKTALDEGFNPALLEQSDAIGGVWSERTFNNQSASYSTLTTNTSKEMSSFSDLAIEDDELPTFLTVKQYRQYFLNYCEKFDLNQRINLNSKVVSIVPVDSSDGKSLVGSNGYIVKWLENGKHTKEKRFDRVVVATGPYNVPKMIHINGQEKFKGRIIHTKDFVSPEKFQGNRRMVVVGCGCSSIDIAHDLVKSSGNNNSSVVLSMRASGAIVPRTIFRLPVDQSLFSFFRYQSMMPFTLWYAFKTLPYISIFSAGSVRSSSFFNRGFNDKTTFAINDGCIDLIKQGVIKVENEIDEIVGENSVKFKNGNVLDDVDTIILGTGFKKSLPFLDPSLVDTLNEKTLGLYMKVYPTTCTNLALVGFTRIVGSAIPVDEFQARHVMAVWSGKINLPTLQAMKRQKGLYSPDKVRPLAYIDQLASQLGSKPSFWKLIFDPKLLYVVFFYPINIMQWRLFGIAKREDARERLIDFAKGCDRRNTLARNT